GMMASFPAGQGYEGARQVFLYAIANGDALDGAYVRPVVRVSITDIGDLQNTYVQYYQYDPTEVIYDPASTLAQFATVRLLPGSQSGANGYAVYYYSNGVSGVGRRYLPVGTTFNFFLVLNGELLREEVYDRQGQQISSITREPTV